jgi:hypothetical protein
MFEAVQLIEFRDQLEPEETELGVFDDEADAVEAARAARDSFMESGSDDYAWWVVRKPGARLARFISDSKSNKEFVLDLTSGQLVEV